MTFLPVSSLFEYMLTGKINAERSMAGASVMMDASFKEWNLPLLKQLGIPAHMMPDVVEAGTFGGPLLKNVAAETGCSGCRYIHTVEFDSSSAIVGAPGLDTDRIFLSMGTMINPGVLLDAPLVNDEIYARRYKNVPVWHGKSMLLSDIPGMFILSQCMKKWRSAQPQLDYDEVVHLAEQEKIDAVIDLFEPVFMMERADMPDEIASLCARTGQPVPHGIGQTARVLFLSYAFAIAQAVQALEHVTGRNDYREIIAVSGASRNRLLCQMIADAAHMQVSAGSPLATCLGNLLVQFHTLGKLQSSGDMQKEAARVCPMVRYLPQNTKH